MVTKSALTAAQQSSSATAMARTLLMSVFDLETLLNSNLKGGQSKRPGGDETCRLQKLDAVKLDSIYS